MHAKKCNHLSYEPDPIGPLDEGPSHFILYVYGRIIIHVYEHNMYMCIYRVRCDKRFITVKYEISPSVTRNPFVNVPSTH